MEHMRRFLSTVVLLPPLLLFFFYASEFFFALLIFGFMSLSLREYFRMLVRQQLPVCKSTVYVAAFALAGASYWEAGQWLSLVLFVSLVGLTLHVLLASKEAEHFFPMWLHGAFGIVFIGWCLSHLIVLRGLPDGKWYIFFLCIVVWVGDSLAMYTGKMFGQHKLSPLLSPGKTWEGALGGTAGGMVAAVVSASFLLPQLSLGHSALLGLLTTVTAQMSDLAESMVKRYTRVKDSGSLIPGHGGMFDRLDSLFFAAPTLVYTLEILLHLSSL